MNAIFGITLFIVLVIWSIAGIKIIIQDIKEIRTDFRAERARKRLRKQMRL